MALDTTSLNPGVGGSKVLHDSLTTADGGAAPTSAVAPVHKLAFGDAGDARQVSPSYGFPVGGQQAGYAPPYGSASGDGGSLAFDPSGQLVARATVLTDEGTARVNFANASLSVGIGSPSIFGLRVTGFTAGSDVHAGDYFKYDGDAESSWARIDGFDSTGAIVLESSYSGFPSGTASRVLVKPFTGAGGALAVASGQLTITSGATASSVTGVERQVDYAPLVFRARLSLSQRVANQDGVAGMWDRSSKTAPKWFARFRFTGTTNTSVICETGRNPTTAPSASETQSTTATCLSTAGLREYRVELLTESVRFYIEGVLVAEHSRVMPAQYDDMTCGVYWNNTGAPATSDIVVDYITVKNHNKLEVGILSDAEMIGIRPSPQRAQAYNVAGVIAINTVLGQFDCSQAGNVMVQCVSMGTTGVVTPEWSLDGSTWGPATITTPAGADAVTFNAAGLWRTAVFARYFRLRLSTATTGGTTTLSMALGSLEPVSRLATQPVSGTVTANLGTGGTAATSLGKAEDAVAASGDTGVPVWGVRRDALTTSSSAAARYNEFAFNRFGAAYMTDFRLLARTYRALTAAFTLAAAATDVWDLFGNVTTTVVVTRIRVYGTQTTGGTADIRVRLRTTANSAGTRVASTVVKLEQADAAASSTPGHYTANPTVGTDAGAIAGGVIYLPAPANGVGFVELALGDKGKGVVLSGTAQGIAVSLGGTTPTGGAVGIEVEWYEF